MTAKRRMIPRTLGGGLGSLASSGGDVTMAKAATEAAIAMVEIVAKLASQGLKRL